MLNKIETSFPDEDCMLSLGRKDRRRMVVDGTDVGMEVGFDVGAFVGLHVGAFVGLHVGALVGLHVGALVGLNVDTFTGFIARISIHSTAI